MQYEVLVLDSLDVSILFVKPLYSYLKKKGVNIHCMVDKIEAEKASQSAPDPVKEIVEAATISERQRSRKEWESLKSDVSKLLDDDLDL